MRIKNLLYPWVLIFFAGCATYNIEWAKSNNILIREASAPLGKWDINNFENFMISLGGEINRDLRWTNGKPNILFVVRVPANYWDDVVRYSNVEQERAVCFYKSPIVIFTKEDFPCLDHEIGHLREYLEGVPYHSKHAW